MYCWRRSHHVLLFSSFAPNDVIVKAERTTPRHEDFDDELLDFEERARRELRRPAELRPRGAGEELRGELRRRLALRAELSLHELRARRPRLAGW